jgi:hypothetical protein
VPIASCGNHNAHEHEWDTENVPRAWNHEVWNDLHNGDPARQEGERRPDPGEEGPFVGQAEPVIGILANGPDTRGVTPPASPPMRGQVVVVVAVTLRRRGRGHTF